MRGYTALRVLIAQERSLDQLIDTRFVEYAPEQIGRS